MHTISIWIEVGEQIHTFEHTFANSIEFMTQFIYPADLFVMLQPYADELDLDWDFDHRELYLWCMSGRRLRENEPGQRGALKNGETNLGLLSVRGLREILQAMAEREWNDVLFVKDVTPAKLALEKEYLENLVTDMGVMD
jgi:hypothetical protein